ncbi:MAG: hypothetical protein QOI95_2011 [Acidimicrobiaceae bacterium]|jgi:NAD(P)-dependent dehydrogenase (short-subunit alcohol dehydrogenase family)
MILDECAVLVSGGASGLGEASAIALAETGADVTIIDVDMERGPKVAASIGGSFIRADVTDEVEVGAAVAAIADKGVALRAVVNCAGITNLWGGRLVGREGEPMPLEPYRRLLDVNLVGTFNVMRLAAALIAKGEPMEDGARGVIVNTASIAAFEGQVSQIAYAASKGGVVAMTLPAARDLAAYGIRVCTIAPGIFATPLVAAMPEHHRGALTEGVVFPHRAGKPSEFAQLARCIIENDFLNGEVIRLDGALRLSRK